MPNEEIVLPAKLAIGPPAPFYFSIFARATMLALLICIGHWVQSYLGGVSMHATDDGKGGADTSKLFNWHPILMTLAFGVFMAEALLTYQVPLWPGIPRETRKKIHWGCHSAAIVCALLGVTAAFKSHSLKKPTPIPDLYSPHSFLGMTTLVMVGLQFLVGLTSYVAPRASLPFRLALGPVHKFAGYATWSCGLAAMATGLQEKVTFLQLGKALSGDALYGAVIRLPAVAVVLLVVLAVSVLYHQVPPAQPLNTDKTQREGLLESVTQE
eukprot:CAMPEP_0202857748 /NCGR_PEP_ID=MMETSP1391-20130828/565_1 /ASSEMBLY_ACC=CAM_ASM_000867 /TAXON_ID=1034604 /ORGANISM="Chlamydomonas leiostraca, Strain SAG 11-49" /LENGTH=268 /DNA_ID=CAMNT_0049536589 /DNA_START=138 /DNA_END=944 /DNA_ORIENTATION=+